MYFHIVIRELYAECLKKQLDKSINQFSQPVLRNTLGHVQNYLLRRVDHNASNSHIVESDLQVGKHSADFWIGNNTKTWYLELVEKVNDDGVYVYCTSCLILYWDRLDLS